MKNYQETIDSLKKPSIISMVLSINRQSLGSQLYDVFGRTYNNILSGPITQFNRSLLFVLLRSKCRLKPYQHNIADNDYSEYQKSKTWRLEGSYRG